MIWLSGVLGLAAAGVALWGLRRRFLVVTVYGPSMSPTYHDGDRVLVRRVPGERASAGQVVVADLPPVDLDGGSLPPGVEVSPVPAAPPVLVSGPPEPVGSRVVKRVAAVAGERTPAGIRDARPVVPPGKVVLLGDNPSASNDSRQYGYIPADTVIGVVLRRMR